MRIITITSAALALLVVPATALAEPTPNPVDAASLADSRPLYSWNLPAGEEIYAVEVASKPDVTPDGEFFSENRVDYGSVDATATSYQDTTRMYAGTYWWNIFYKVVSPYSSHYTAPATFTIPLQNKVLGASVTQYIYVSDSVDVTYRSNAKTAVVTASIYSGRKLIARKSKVDSYITPLEKEKVYVDGTKIGRQYGGKKLKLVVQVKAGGKVASLTKFFYGRRG